jgi:hypothetical protein
MGNNQVNNKEVVAIKWKYAHRTIKWHRSP